VILLKKWIPIIVIAIFINLLSSNAVLFSEKEDSIFEIEVEMTSLNSEELQLLDELFQLEQNIIELEKESSLLTEDIESLNTEVDSIQTSIEDLDVVYSDNLSTMESFLQNYQKKGPLNTLQLILSSENLSTMLSRLNSIRELSKGVSTLLEDLEEDKITLENKKNSKEQTLITIKKRQEELQVSKENQEIAIDDLETRLSSLKEDRSKYENYLADIDNSWKKTKPEFTNTISAISKIVESGNLPNELVDLKYQLTGITARIYDQSFNKALNNKKLPTKVEIEFNKDNMTLNLPELNIYLSGNLELIDDTTLQFNIVEGKYLDLTLGQSSIESLFDSNYLKFNFKEILMGNTIETLKTNDTNIELLLNTIF
jgi:peptidoglycan hydrolase CwlO-like protein